MVNKETLREIAGSAKQLTREGTIKFIDYKAFYNITLNHYEYEIHDKNQNKVFSKYQVKRDKDLDLIFLSVFAEIEDVIKEIEKSV